MSEPLIITIFAECNSLPPEILKRSKDDFYVAFYENDCGDSWLFVFNQSSRAGFLYGFFPTFDPQKGTGERSASRDLIQRVPPY